MAAMRQSMQTLVLSILLVISFFSHAETVLPDVLEFDYVMNLVDEGQYLEAMLANEELNASKNSLLAASAINDLNIELSALAQYVDPVSNSTDRSNDDHSLSILLKKDLLDGGFSSAKSEVAEARIQAAQLTIQQIRLEKRIEVAKKFFDIKLADLKFALDNEAISTAYIKFNKTEERNALKQSSDVDLLQAEFEYQQVRARRYESETLQRISRARFAESIARPKDLPADVILPDFSILNKERADYETLLALALKNNLSLRAQQKIVEAANYEVEAQRERNGSKLSSELEWAEYSQELPSKNNWRASLKYTVPLYENDQVKAEIAKALMTWRVQRIRLAQMESDLRQQLLEAWQSIYVIKARQDIDTVAESYRELYQDRSRAYYEMEYRTDLGDSFVRVSEARLEKIKNNSDLMLAWMKLAQLTGLTLEEFIQQ